MLIHIFLDMIATGVCLLIEGFCCFSALSSTLGFIFFQEAVITFSLKLQRNLTIVVSAPLTWKEPNRLLAKVKGAQSCSEELHDLHIFLARKKMFNLSSVYFSLLCFQIILYYIRISVTDLHCDIIMPCNSDFGLMQYYREDCFTCITNNNF